MHLIEKKIFVHHNEHVVMCMHIDPNSKLKLTLDVFKQQILINPFIFCLICFMCQRTYINTQVASYIQRIILRLNFSIK